MKYEIHYKAAEEHMRIAEESDKKLKQEKDKDKRTALMMVAAQNYFYSAVNAIEAVFAKKLNEHSYSHENRFRKFIENSNLFKKEVVELFPLIDRDKRNKIAYRGKNGRNYKELKELAMLLGKNGQV